MDHAVKIDQESRQSEVMRNRRNNSSELIDTTVNEISNIDINYVASRQGDRQIQQHNETWIPKKEKISPLGTGRTTHSRMAEVGTALGMTTKTSGRLTNTNIMPENLGTTSSSSTVSAEVKRKS